MAAGAWWAVALSESVNGQKPFATVCAGQELVLFRNDAGTALALEDRCPHRRVPLSPGRIKPGGLMCPYHGWTFDGVSGNCVDIPNLRRDERIPARYSALAYPVAEANGFVHAWIGSGAPAGELPGASHVPAGAEFTGSTVVSMTLDDYLDAMLDGPQCLLEFPGAAITDFFLGDPTRIGNHLQLDRGVVWKSQQKRAAFVEDQPLILRTRVPLAGGDIGIELLAADETPLVGIFIAATTNRRGTTGLCWRGFRHVAQPRNPPLRWRLANRGGKPPFRIFEDVNGKAIAGLLVAPSHERSRLREPLTVHSIPLPETRNVK